MFDRFERLSRAYNALCGLEPLDAIADILKDGTATPDFLKALARRLEPAYEGDFDQFRLVLVKRETLGPVQQKKRAEKLQMISDMAAELHEAKRKKRAIKPVVWALADRFNVSRAQVYELTKGLW